MTKRAFFQNFLIRISSAVAIVFLVLGLVFVISSYLAGEPNNFVGLMIIAFAVLISILAIVAANFAIFNLSTELKESTFRAEKIAQGEIFFSDEEKNLSEIKSALRQIEVNFSERIQMIERAAAGDFDFDVTLYSDSDIFGQALQRLITRFKNSILTDEYKENLNKSVQSLLTKSSQIINGDYSVKVFAFLPEMEPAARAFNSMVLSLNLLIYQIKKLTEESLYSARKINDSVERLDRENDLQIDQTSQSSIKLSQLISQAQKMSENSRKFLFLSENLRFFSQNGVETLEEERRVVSLLRNQAQETTKKMKKLGENSQEVCQLVNMLLDLRDKVSLLLLNAKLYSSSGQFSERKSEFFIQEVKQISQSFDQFSSQVQGLVQAIQSGIQELIVSMEEIIHEIVACSALLNKNVRSFSEIKNNADELNGLSFEMEALSVQNGKFLEDIIRLNDSVTRSTKTSEANIKQASNFAGNLLRFLEELSSLISNLKTAESVVQLKETRHIGEGDVF